MKTTVTYTMVSFYLMTLVATLLSRGLLLNAQTDSKTTLRIAVPPKSGFTEFVRIIRDPVTGALNFSGFAIEVFNQAVAATVNQSLSFEFIPFVRPDGTMNGSYDDMVKAVFDEEYDAAVGDITIRFSRTQWVDFTVSYTATGISMLVPRITTKATNSLTSLFTFVTVIGTLIYFILGIFPCLGVFLARRRGIAPLNPVDAEEGNRAAERRTDNWRRDILEIVKGMTVLLFLAAVLCLINYYGEKLTSSLSREPLKERNGNLNQLIRNNERVGYPYGSFMYDLLKQVGLSDHQLFSYRSEEELLAMLNKGNEDGGVAVALGETPPLSVFLAHHCSNYTLVPIHDLYASGYGYAFKKGSKLEQEVSNGIIKLIDNGQIERIQARTIGSIGICDAGQGESINYDDIANQGNIWSFIACTMGYIVLLVIAIVLYLPQICDVGRSCYKA